MGEYNYWFLGTGLGFRCEKQDRTLNIILLVDGTWGPTQDVKPPQTIQVGSVAVNQWVGAVASLSRDLSNMFRR